MRGARVAFALALAAVGAVPATAQAAVTACTTSGPGVCIDLEHTPDGVSASTPGSTTYVSLSAIVRNRGTSTATHVSATDRLPAGTSLVGATTSRGLCTSVPESVTCDIGRLPAGDAVTLSLSVTAPAAAGTVTNAVTAAFDETTNDSSAPDPKQDSVLASDAIGVTLEAGSVESWVPANTPANLSTDPTGAGVATPAQPEVAGVHVPAQPAGRIASLARAAGAFSCPKKEVCRDGDWTQASVPGTFLDPPLEFRLRWDASLVARKQSERNFAVFYTTCLDGCAVQTISRRCSSATPLPLEQPCLWAVKEELDGDFSAVLIQDHNGYMR